MRTRFCEDYAALLFYVDDFFGGAERRLIRIYNEIGKNRKCDLIVRGINRKKLDELLEKADCDVKNYQNVLCFPSNLDCIMYLFLKGKYTSVHFFDMSRFDKLLLYVTKIKRIKSIMTIAFQNYAYGLINNKEKKELETFLALASNVDVLFPAGEIFLPTISKKQNISVTPGTFTNLALFRPAKKERILLFAAARFDKDKNALLLVEACNLCAKVIRDYKYKVIMCGKGNEEDNLRNRVKEYELEDIIEMPGYVKISELFPYVEMFLCLDKVDNYPSQTIAESVACGCALVCTDVGYSRRCGDENFTYFIKDDCNELAQVIIKYIELNDTEKNKMSGYARKFALQHYAIDSSVKYFERMIEV